MAQVHLWQGNGDPTNHGMAKKEPTTKQRECLQTLPTGPWGTKPLPAEKHLLRLTSFSLCTETKLFFNREKIYIA